MSKKIMVVFGTRPEAIKMAPLVQSLMNNKKFTVKVCVTAQHREMLDQVLDLFEIFPDYDLDLMTKGQSPQEVISSILSDLRPILKDFSPDLILVHGDTATTLAASIAAYYEKISLGLLRLDKIGGYWNISYLIDKKYRGFGLGQKKG